MKRIYKILVVLLLVFMQFSCEEAEKLEPESGTKVGSVCLIGTDGTKHFSEMGDDYKEGDTIVVKVKGPYKYNLSKMSMFVDIPNDAKVENPLGSVMDLTKPVDFTVVDCYGKTQSYTVRAEHVIILEKNQLWVKPGSNFGFTEHNNGAVAISGDYLVVHSRTGFKYYNIEDASEAGTMSWEGIDMSPFPLHITNDDADNIISCNFSFGAGKEIRMYGWEGVTAEPKMLFKWMSDAPGQVGRKVYVKGDITKDAYIYAGVSLNNMFLRWEIKDGVVTSEVPDKITFNNPNGVWGVQPKIVPLTAEKNSNYLINTTTDKIHITYMDGKTNTPLYNSVNMKWIWMHQNNGFDYLKVGDLNYLFFLELGPGWRFTSYFDITPIIEDPATANVNPSATPMQLERKWGSWVEVKPVNGNVTGDVKAKFYKDRGYAIVAFLTTNGAIKVWKLE